MSRCAAGTSLATRGYHPLFVFNCCRSAKVGQIGTREDYYYEEPVLSSLRVLLVGNPAPQDVIPAMERSVRDSLARLKLPRIDLFFLHDRIVPDDQIEHYRELLGAFSLRRWFQFLSV